MYPCLKLVIPKSNGPIVEGGERTKCSQHLLFFCCNYIFSSPFFCKFALLPSIKNRHDHNAVEIDIFGLCIHLHLFAHPPPREINQGRMTSFPLIACFVSSRSQVSHFVSQVGVLACCSGISIDHLNVVIYVHKHNLESPWPYDVNCGKSFHCLYFDCNC